MLLLVTGASGAGKSTVRRAIAPRLEPSVECVELWEVLPPTGGISRVWRQQAAEAAVQRALVLQAEGRHLLLAGDPVPAAEIAAAPTAPELDGFVFCLLDLSADAQAARLTERGDDPSVLHHHHAFAEWMRRHAGDPTHMTHVLADGGWEKMRWDRLGSMAAQWEGFVVDTTTLTATEAAEVVLDWARRAIGGEMPTLHAPAD